jgi:hypothetical protein
MNRTIATNSHKELASTVSSITCQFYGMTNTLSVLKIKRQTNVPQ